jgi:hypothetical protein
MRTVGQRRRFFVAGQPVELWENPDFALDWSAEGLRGHIERGEWELLFNALALLAQHPPDPAS